MMKVAQRLPRPTIEIPAPPEHYGALAEIPSEVRERWKARYAEVIGDACEEYEEMQQQLTPEILQGIARNALREANRLLRVSEPQSYADACALPDWQVMKREELAYKKLPAHERHRLKSQERRLASRRSGEERREGQSSITPREERR